MKFDVHLKPVTQKNFISIRSNQDGRNYGFV